MKLSQYANLIGVCYKTALNHYNKGYIIGAYQLPSGTIIVPDDILEKLKQNTPTVTTTD